MFDEIFEKARKIKRSIKEGKTYWYDVKKSLISHDGYDPNIKVKKSK
jgi:hypothetical protein